MSVFELPRKLDEEDSALVLDAVAAYVLAHNDRTYINNFRGLLPFWTKRAMERGIMINLRNIRECAPFPLVRRRIAEMEWNGSPKFDRDFFAGFFDAAATVYPNDFSYRAELSSKPRFKEFLLGDEHGQKIRSCSCPQKSLIRLYPLCFLEIPPLGNLEKYLCGVFSGGRPQQIGTELWVSIRGAARESLDQIGIFYEKGRMNRLLVPPFYIKLFYDDMPGSIASFWREKLKRSKSRISNIVAWMHWEVMFGRKKRRYLEGFPYLKSPQGANRIGLDLDGVRQKMREHRFDHIDSRIADRLLKWMQTKDEEDEDEQDD